MDNNPPNKVSEEQILAALGEYKDLNSSNSVYLQSCSVEEARAGLRKILGDDVADDIDELTEMSLFHSVKEDSLIMAEIMHEFKMSAPDDVAKLTDLNAYGAFEAARHHAKYAMLAAIKFGVTLLLPHEKLLKAKKTEDFNQWTAWWSLWSDSLMMDEQAITVVAGHMRLGYDVHIKPQGSWKDLTDEQILKFKNATSRRNKQKP